MGPLPSASRDYVLALSLLFLVLALTGVGLLLRYEPDPAAAHAAVERIEAGPMGIARSVHAWGANAVLVVIVVAGAHGVMAFPSLLAWKPWTAGFAVLVVALVAYWTGGVLSWDHQAWESYQHGARALGAEATDPNETPLLLLLLAHMAAPTGGAIAWIAWKRRAALATWKGVSSPRMLPATVVSLGTAGVCALVWRPRLGPAPIEGLAVSRPEWPFLWLLPLQDRWGPLAVWALPALLAIAFAGVPLLRERGPRARVAFLACVFALLGTLTLVALVTE